MNIMASISPWWEKTPLWNLVKPSAFAFFLKIFLSQTLSAQSSISRENTSLQNKNRFFILELVEILSKFFFFQLHQYRLPKSIEKTLK